MQNDGDWDQHWGLCLREAEQDSKPVSAASLQVDRASTHKGGKEDGGGFLKEAKIKDSILPGYSVWRGF